MSSAPSLLIAGAGDVGARLARRQSAAGVEVLALRRRDREVPGARLLRADLASGEGLQRLPRRIDALVFCAAPEARDEAAYRRLYLDGLRRLLDRVEAPRIVFVSSTSVYGQDAGEWVGETSPAVPAAFNGRVLLEAEGELGDHPGAVALRLSGLYGPGRESLLERARKGLASARRWSNRIHVDDAAAALALLSQAPSPQRLYLGSDDAPTLEHQLQDWVRSMESLPAIAAGPGPETGRRIANTRLRGAGWQPVHPDFRSGYRPLLSPEAGDRGP